MQTIHTLTAAELHTLRATVKDTKQILRDLREGKREWGGGNSHILWTLLQSLELQLGGVPQ